VTISVLAKTWQVLIRMLAPGWCAPDQNSHDARREIRHGVQCCTPFPGGAVVAFRRFRQCTGANLSWHQQL